MKNWSEYSLKKQLLLIFGSLSFFTLMIISISAILFIVISVVLVKNQLYQGLLLQSTNNLKKISSDGALIFDKKLGKYADNFLGVLANSADDCFRNDYPFNNIKSYYNWPGELIDSFYSPAYNAKITLKSSTINVFNKTLFDLPILNFIIHDTINRTASLDQIFIPLYKHNKDFLAGYISTFTDFLRYYPGAFNDSKLNQYINYRPTTDYWFTSTVKDSSNNLRFGSPYYDPIAGQFMISITKKIYNGTNLIGAAGSDLILNTIQNDIKKITYLQNGRAILFEIDTGIIIADSLSTYNGVSTYEKIKNPNIDSNVWNKLISSGELLETSNHYLISNRLNNSGNNYILISIASKSDIYGIFSFAIEAIDSILIADIIAVCIVSPIIILIIVLLVIWLTNNIISPIQKLTEDTNKMVNNIGSNIVENISTPTVSSNIKETQEFQINFQKLRENIIKQQQQKYSTVSDNIENDLYNKLKPWENKIPSPSAPLYKI